MRAELAYAADARTAMTHARGCLIAAIGERGRDFATLFAAGMAGIALITAACAVTQIVCAARGIAVLLGAPDAMLAALMRGDGADAAMASAYHAAMPLVVTLFLLLGAIQLAAAWFLVRWRLRHFAVASALAALVASVAVTIQLSIVWTLDGVPSEFHALLVQVLALPLLLSWSGGRHRRLRRAI